MISRRLLHAILFTPLDDHGALWGIPTLFWGEPGVGKTEVLESLGKTWKMPVETLSPGERGEGAFGVTPVPSPDMRYMTYPPPDWKQKFDEARRGLVFIDEINTASNHLQAPLLGLVQARRIGGAFLGGGVRMLAAANPPEAAAGGWDLAPPLANRFAHFDWTSPTISEWSDWLLGQTEALVEGNAEEEERRVLSHLAAPYASARGMVMGFLRRRPEFLHKRPPTNDPAASRGWPSPRSWHLAVRALAAAKIHKLDALDTEEYARALVGPGAANEFVAWKLSTDLPEPLDVLDEKVRFDHDPKRLDRTLAILSACTALVLDPQLPERDRRTTVLWLVLATCLKNAEDIAVGPTRALVKAKLDILPASKPVLAKLFRVLQASTPAPV